MKIQILALLILLITGHGMHASTHDSLFWAVMGSDEEKVERLIAGGADVNRQDRHGTTPLHVAAKFGNRKLTELLLAAGANVNLQNNCEETALHNAAQSNEEDVIQLLLDANAEINKQNCFGDTPLHYASQWKKIKAVQFLIAAGADTEIINHGGYTAEQSITHNDIITLK